VTIAVPALVALPDLTGETPREAARLLHRYQLGLGQERQRESDARPGTVIRQSPAPGTRVPRETPVNILVATAPPAAPKPPIVIAPPGVIAPPIVITPPVVIKPPVVIAPPVVSRAAGRDRAARPTGAAGRRSHLRLRPYRRLRLWS
jgi:hypothetical protein